MIRVRMALAVASSAVAYALVVALLVGTGGDPNAIVDSLANLQRFELGLPFLLVAALAAGALASWPLLLGLALRRARA